MALADNWQTVVNRYGLVNPPVGPQLIQTLKFVGPTLQLQLAAMPSGAASLAALVTRMAGQTRRGNEAWLRARLRNPRAALCVGQKHSGRNHGSHNRFRVNGVNKFAWNAVITWLRGRMTVAQRYQADGSDRLPALMPTRGTAVAFPAVCN